MKTENLEILFEKDILPYTKIVYKVCHQYTNCHDDCNDLFQEIMFQLWKSYKNFKRTSKTSTWVYKVAINTALYNLRKENKNIATTKLVEECFFIPDSEDAKQIEEQLETLKQLINKLSEIEKAIIMLHLDEFSNDEIASIVGISKTNVSTRLNRIKQKLLNTKQNGI